MVFRKFVVATASAIVIMSLPAAVSAQSNQIQQAMRYCRPDMSGFARACRRAAAASPGASRRIRWKSASAAQ
jgi:hypothetical protein